VNLLRSVFRRPRSMDTAPGDGTTILVYLIPRSSSNGERREICWNPFDNLWRAGDPQESFAEEMAKAWSPSPPRP
jgi:hypothetical protein